VSGIAAVRPSHRKEFSVALKNSPMKRAKLRGLKRHAAVMLGNAGTGDDGA
jgi:epoxyqueuosine reductase